MANWVWRADGTLQCGLGTEEDLDEARAQLAAVIGEDQILAGEKRTLPGVVIALCGAPTSEVNAFDLTDYGYWLLFHGIVGPIGFRPWIDEPAAAAANASPSAMTSATELEQVLIVGTRTSHIPSHLADLYGRVCRVYNVGDVLTKDHLPGRFNVGLDRGRIKELWFG